MILITAATGQYGRLVVDALLQTVAPKEVAVAVRHPPQPPPGTGVERAGLPVEYHRGWYKDRGQVSRDWCISRTRPALPWRRRDATQG